MQSIESGERSKTEGAGHGRTLKSSQFWIYPKFLNVTVTFCPAWTVSLSTYILLILARAPEVRRAVEMRRVLIATIVVRGDESRGGVEAGDWKG
jgi:hypothetical protein